MLSKFWSNAPGKEKINEVLDDTIKSLTNLSDMLKRLHEYHINNIDDIIPKKPQEFSLGLKNING